MTKDKPDVEEIMYLTLFVGNRGEIGVRNLILPLAPIRIEETEEKFKVIIKLARKEIDFKEVDQFKNISIGVTNDPYAEWASDWGHLGTFRLAINLKNAKLDTDEKDVTFTCLPSDYEKRMNMPDRRMVNL